MCVSAHCPRDKGFEKSGRCQKASVGTEYSHFDPDRWTRWRWCAGLQLGQLDIVLCASHTQAVKLDVTFPNYCALRCFAMPDKLSLEAYLTNNIYKHKLWGILISKTTKTLFVACNVSTWSLKKQHTFPYFKVLITGSWKKNLNASVMVQ